MTPFYIRLDDYKQLLKPTGPLFAFIVPWLVVIIFQLIALCDIIVPSYSSFYIIVIGNIISICLFAFLLQTYLPVKLSSKSFSLETLSLSLRFKRLTYIMTIFVFMFELLQSIVFKGFPLLWLITGNKKNYFDFGFSSLNGLVNAVFLLTITSFFLLFLKERKKYQLLILLFLFLLPVLLMCRQLLMCAFLEIACCSLIYKPKLFKKYLSSFYFIFYFINSRSNIFFNKYSYHA